MPFLSIVTRCYKRPKALRLNVVSVAKQTDRDWEQVFITDDEGRGLLWANKSLYLNRHRVKGDYVLILDDDNILYHNKVVEHLKAVVAAHDPDILIVKLHQIKRLLPTDEVWGKQPVFGHIDTGCFVVRHDVWVDNIILFGQPYGGDCAFIGGLFAQIEYNGWKVCWHDEVMTAIQRVSYGKPE